MSQVVDSSVTILLALVYPGKTPSRCLQPADGPVRVWLAAAGKRWLAGRVHTASSLMGRALDLHDPQVPTNLYNTSQG